MKKFNITVFFIFFITLEIKAQYVKDINGKPVTLKSYTDVVGNPYLYDSWITGSVLSVDSKKMDNVFLKYDAVDDVLYFKSEKNEPLLFVDQIKSFDLDLGSNKETFANGFPPIDNFTSLSYYQVIFKGDIYSLLMKNKKIISENRPYNSATTERKFIDNYNYYIFKNGKMERFKPSKKEVIELFNDKSNQVSDFIKKNNIDFKNNDDLNEVFSFYETLK